MKRTLRDLLDLLSTAGAAEVLDVTPRRVLQMDDLLQPLRLDGGRGDRIYLRAKVELVAGARAAQRRAPRRRR